MKRLVLKNLHEFLELEFSNSFEIIYKLENEIKNTNKVLETILIPYKENGDIIFDLSFLIIDNDYKDRSDFIDMDFNLFDLNNIKDKKIIFGYNYSTTIS